MNPQHYYTLASYNKFLGPKKKMYLAIPNQINTAQAIKVVDVSNGCLKEVANGCLKEVANGCLKEVANGCLKEVANGCLKEVANGCLKEVAKHVGDSHQYIVST